MWQFQIKFFVMQGSLASPSTENLKLLLSLIDELDREFYGTSKTGEAPRLIAEEPRNLSQYQIF